MRSGIALIVDGRSLWYKLSNIRPRGEKVDIEVGKEVIWKGGMCTIVHCQLPHFLLNLPKWSFKTKDDARKQLLGHVSDLWEWENGCKSWAGRLQAFCSGRRGANWPHIIIQQANTIKTFLGSIRSVEWKCFAISLLPLKAKVKILTPLPNPPQTKGPICFSAERYWFHLIVFVGCTKGRYSFFFSFFFWQGGGVHWKFLEGWSTIWVIHIHNVRGVFPFLEVFPKALLGCSLKNINLHRHQLRCIKCGSWPTQFPPGPPLAAHRTAPNSHKLERSQIEQGNTSRENNNPPLVQATRSSFSNVKNNLLRVRQ